MCPFCISALAIVAAKAVAAGGGGAILTKLALNKGRKPDRAPVLCLPAQEAQGREIRAEGPLNASAS